MPIKKKKSKAPIKKTKAKAKPRSKVNPKEDQITKAYKAGLLAGIPAYGSIPRTGGNYTVGQVLPQQIIPQQVFSSQASVPIGSNKNQALIDLYNSLLFSQKLPSKKQFETLTEEDKATLLQQIENLLGREAVVNFKNKMKLEQSPSDINPLFQEIRQKGGFDIPTAKTFSNVISGVINDEINDDPTTNTYFTGSSFINKPSRLPRQTSDIFELNQIEKQDNALSNLARQTQADQEDIEVSQTLENQAYPQGILEVETKTQKPRGRPKKTAGLIIEE